MMDTVLGPEVAQVSFQFDGAYISGPKDCTSRADLKIGHLKKQKTFVTIFLMNIFNYFHISPFGLHVSSFFSILGPTKSPEQD